MPGSLGAVTHNGGIRGQLTISVSVAENWCESWFGADAMLEYKETDWLMEPEDPACCENLLIRDFVTTILKIYQLCHSV